MTNVKKEAIDYQTEYSTIHARLTELKTQADKDPKSAIPLLQKLLQDLKKIESREQKINDNIRHQTQQLQINVDQSIIGTGRKEVQYKDLEYKLEQQENVIFKKLDNKIESLQTVLSAKNDKIEELLKSNPIPQKILIDNVGAYERIVPLLKKVLEPEKYAVYENTTGEILSKYREFREMQLQQHNQEHVKTYSVLKEKLKCWERKLELEKELLQELTDDLKIQNKRCSNKWVQLDEEKKKFKSKIEAKRETLTVKFEHNKDILKDEIRPLNEAMEHLEELEGLVNAEQSRLNKLRKNLDDFQFYCQTYWQEYLKDPKSSKGSKEEKRKRIDYWKQKSDRINQEFDKFIKKSLPDMPNRNFDNNS